MKLHKKQAFSLTELLIVLVIVAILFAALAPILTKRRSGRNNANELIWNYVSDDDQKDAFYDPGHPKWTSTAYIGINPNVSDIIDSSPRAKVVINAKKNQNMLQLRYGSGNGLLASTLFMDDKNNILLSSANSDFITNSSSKGMTVAGPYAFQREKGNYSIAVGAEALRGSNNPSANGYAKLNTIPDDARYIMVGSSSGKNIKNDFYGDNLTYVGSLSGQIDGTTKNGVSVGAFSTASQNYYGQNNVNIGYNTGGGGITKDMAVPDIVQNSVIVGSSFNGKIINASNYPRQNVILGYGTYTAGLANVRDITAVGFGACDAAGSLNASRTCIGYSSGAEQNGTPDGFRSDSNDRVFLGGKPNTGLAGRGVVETHSVPGAYNPYYHDAVSREPSFGNSSAVFNSNIVVRGNFYTTDDGGTLSGTGLTQVTRPFTDGTYCNGDWYISICGWRTYQCTMFGSKTNKSHSIMDFDGQNCNISKAYTYPTTQAKCPNLKSSDIRLKENISDYKGGLNEILALKPYNYVFKSDKAKTLQTGVIAQDLQKVFPNSVTKGDDGYLRIRWDEMFYSAINAIKILDRKVDSIAAEITGMEKDVKDLHSRHQKLQKRIASLNARAAKLENK